MGKFHNYERKRTVLGQRSFDRWKFTALVLLGFAITLITIVVVLLK